MVGLMNEIPMDGKDIKKYEYNNNYAAHIDLLINQGTTVILRREGKNGGREGRSHS